MHINSMDSNERVSLKPPEASNEISPFIPLKTQLTSMRKGNLLQKL